jgi:hypothetical protein
MRWCLVTVAVAAVLIGCGGGGRSSKSADGVRTTGREFVNDFKDRKFGDACELMTPTARAEMGRAFGKANGASGCAAILAFARAFIGTETLKKLAAQFDKTRVTIRGDTATVGTDAPGNLGGRFRYVGGQWYVDSARRGAASSTRPPPVSPT